MNLLPIGQLDGGHVIYSVAGARHRQLSWIFLGVLVIFGIVFWRWWFFWVILLYFGRGIRRSSIPSRWDRGAGSSPGSCC